MGRIVRSVSLDPDTDDIAEDIGNFSHFVRACLRDHRARQLDAVASDDELFHRPVDAFGGVCNGRKPTRCRKCYPNSKPSSEAWLEYVLDYKEKKITQEEAWAKLQATMPEIRSSEGGVFKQSSPEINGAVSDRAITEGAAGTEGNIAIPSVESVGAVVPRRSSPLRILAFLWAIPTRAKNLITRSKEHPESVENLP